jgi:hypothetical protein
MVGPAVVCAFAIRNGPGRPNRRMHPGHSDGWLMLGRWVSEERYVA